MDALLECANTVKIPTSTDKIYKDECAFSFDTPESDTGLYVSMTTFLGLGRDHVERYHLKTGHSVFLFIRREKREVSSPLQGDGPDKKITRLAIGVEGGFPSETKKYEYDDSYNIVVMPGFVTIAWPQAEMPDNIQQCVEAIINMPSATKVAELESLAGTWDGECRQVSKFCENLLQLPSDKKVPPFGWQCEKCDKTENLWLNLSDGAILCGRKFFDGSGGNNHAIEHYNNTGYPLAVKLGTITKEGKADVFSYSEDDMVEDTNLIQHLAHWGINISSMEKTEKSMIELELELNQKSNEWAALQESSGQLQPINGPGYTGIANLGNSCYLNSVMQILFRIPDFIKRYYDDATTIFEQFPENPAEDLNIQMAKIGVGLLSGKYSQPSKSGDELPGINLQMFKSLIGKGHPEFSTKKQQDAQEFLIHLLTQLERSNKTAFNPGNCFKFSVEEKFQCDVSKKVKYLSRSDLILSLSIPMDAATNKDEVSSYESKKAEAEQQGKSLGSNALVRPKIDFFSCLESFTQPEVINNFYSTAVKENVSALKTTKLATFPDYLVIQLKKFTLRQDWVPIKLDVSVDMPDLLDIATLRGLGPQPNEELLPEADIPPPPPVFDNEILTKLVDLGFPMEASKRAAYFTENSGVEPAVSWILEHITDSDIGEVFVPPGSEPSQFIPDANSLEMIISMGFSQDQARKALKATDNNVERAMDWIFSHQNELDDTTAPAQPEFRDGNSKYRLVGFISHMGTSTMVGHYVAHVLKNDQWVIYNDNKVAISANPPKDLGYIYLYERI